MVLVSSSFFNLSLNLGDINEGDINEIMIMMKDIQRMKILATDWEKIFV